MSFDHLGTFNLSQFQRLSKYTLAQIQDIDGRITHLSAEIARIGSVAYSFDKAKVTGYTVNPSESYMGRLFRVYLVLGGDPYFDLKLRAKSTQALWLLRADETRAPQVMNDGKVVFTGGLADATSAVLGQQIRDWMSDTLQYKRELLERKIRRALDYSDQLNDEITQLKTIKADASVNGSAANMIGAVQQLITNRTYRAIADDKGIDPDGTMSHAPYSGMEPGPSRPVIDAYYRTLDGYVSPNDGTDNPTNTA